MRGVGSLFNRMEHGRGLIGGQLDHDRALIYSIHQEIDKMSCGRVPISALFSKM